MTLLNKVVSKIFGSNVSSEFIPLEKSIKTGVLSNGVRYLITHNDRPLKKVSLRLVVNVGSVNESDSERGVAHFIEHLVFAGSQYFAEREDVLKFFDQVGVAFGYDLNAYTSFDNTVYMIDVPAQYDVISKACLLLSDFARRARLTDEAIELERTVILDEIRRGNNFMSRASERNLSTLYRGTRYENRLPRGIEEVVRTVTGDQIREFYHKWYRPEYMTVVMAGDFDDGQMQDIVKTYFGSLMPAGEGNQSSRAEFVDEIYPAMQAVSCIDRDAGTALISFNYAFVSAHHPATFAYARESLLNKAMARILCGRLSKRATQLDAPFLNVSDSFDQLVKFCGHYTLRLMVREGNVRETLIELVRELKRLQEHDITDQELDSVRNFLNQWCIHGLENTEHRDSSNRVKQIIDYVSDLDNAADPRVIIPFKQQVLAEMTKEQLRKIAMRFSLTRTPGVISVIASDSIAHLVPSEQEIIELMHQTEQADVPPYEEAVVTRDSFDRTQIIPGTIAEEKEYSGVGVTQLTLSNGMRVLLKPTTFKRDEIMVHAYARGGSSVISAQDWVDFSVAQTASHYAGVGGLTLNERMQYNAGKSVWVAPSVEPYRRLIMAGCKANEINDLTALINRNFVDRNDIAAGWDVAKNMLKGAHKNYAIPQAAYYTKVAQVLMGNHYSTNIITPEQIDASHLENGRNLIKNLFANPADFTVFMIGDFVINDDLRSLIKSDFASINAVSSGQNMVQEVSFAMEPGVTKHVVALGQQETSAVSLIFPCLIPQNAREIMGFFIAFKQLEALLLKKLRFELGTSYAVSISAQPAVFLSSTENRMAISWSIDNNLVDQSVNLVVQTIKDLFDSGLDQHEFEATRAMVNQQIGTLLQSNGYVLTILERWDMRGFDLNDPDLVSWGTVADKITSQEATEIFRKNINPEHFAQVTLVSESQS